MRKFVQKKTLPAFLQKAKEKEKRYAGDALEQMADDIIGEIRDEAVYEELDGIKDMVGALNERDAKVNARWDASLSKAGLSRDNLGLAQNIKNGDIQLVGNISQATPQAIEFDWDKDTVTNTWPDRSTTTDDVLTQTRLHSQFETNPLTGQMDVVPILNPGGDSPLVTNFGRVGQSVHKSDVEGMDSDEFLGKRIMQLLGADVKQNNDGDKTAVDLINSNNGKKVDVELAKARDLNDKGSIGFQVYTEIAPRSIAGTRPLRGSRREAHEIANSMAERVQPLIEEKMNQGLSLGQAVNELVRERKISNSDGRGNPYEGKMLKEEGNYVDEIVYPVVSNKNAALNLATERQDGQRGLVMPIEGAFVGNANAVKDRIVNAGPELLEDVSLHPMPGNRGRFRPSAKLYVDVPLTDAAVQNVGQKDEVLRQLFKTQKKTSN